MYFIQWQLMLYHSEEALMLLPNGRMCGIFFIIWCLNATKDEVINMFPISRSLSTSRRRTDELGSRLERPIHFECKLNEPMHIGMWLLHPAAADHSVSINRQQVQRIFSFSLRSRAVFIVLLHLPIYFSWVPQDSGVGGWRFSGGGLLRRVDCTHQAALPPVVLQRPSPLCASAR